MQTLEVALPKWRIEAETGYKPMTTFWQDFSIAESFGVESIDDTYQRVKQEWSNNYKYWTELVLVLNHKIWYWYDVDPDSPLAHLYNALWRDADNLAMDWTGEALTYFLKITD